MADRTSSTRRIELASVAEREIMRYASDNYLWHYHIHGSELDPMQLLKMLEMDEHPNTVDVSCRRTGKTVAKELHALKKNATEADQELGIVAPREAQSIVNMRYHLDAIRRSDVLCHYINYVNGRRQLADTRYQFANRSVAQAYGIMSQVDGGDLTHASLEEVDDMPHDRLYSNFLLMMGANRRLGAASDSKNEPSIRITGVFKGADTLIDMIESRTYHLLPIVDAYLGIEMGILDIPFVELMRKNLTPDEYIRQLLCQNVSSRHLIWEKWIRKAIQTGLASRLVRPSPMPGEKHKKRGLIGFGYDHSGHGETPEASKYSLVVTEQLGSFTCFIYAKTWPPGTDEAIVKNDLKGLWRYFNPDGAMGDAYGIGMLTALNDELYKEGLTSVDRLAIGDGQSTATNWGEWAFAPIRFEGMLKHQMAQALRSIFNNSQAAIVYFDDHDMTDPETQSLRDMTRQLGNIRPKETKASYSSYQMVNKKLGDDLFDAAMASVWSLINRGAILIPSVSMFGTKTREQLLAA